VTSAADGLPAATDDQRSGVHARNRQAAFRVPSTSSFADVVDITIPDAEGQV